jgi:hypothetical protein
LDEVTIAGIQSSDGSVVERVILVVGADYAQFDADAAGALAANVSAAIGELKALAE